MGIATASLYVGVLHCRLRGKGWSEKYELGGLASYAAAKTAFNVITLARTMLLANTGDVVHARVSKKDTKRERKALDGLPLPALDLLAEAGPPIAIEACNDVKSCIQVALETADGNWANRLIRGVRDSWIANHACIVTPSIPAAVTAADTVAGKTEAVALGTYLRALLQYTVHLEPDPAAGQEGTFLSEPWDSAVVVQVTSRDTGRAFRSGRGRAPAFTNP